MCAPLTGMLCRPRPPARPQISKPCSTQPALHCSALCALLHYNRTLNRGNDRAERKVP